MPDKEELKQVEEVGAAAIETRVEYRAVGRYANGMDADSEPYRNDRKYGHSDAFTAVKKRTETMHGAGNIEDIRIQQRTITETPWKDCK